MAQQTLLHITDCHLVPHGELLLETDTNATLQLVLQQAISEKAPDAIVATGDLVHSGGLEVYRQFLAMVRSVSQKPLLCLPGNHDFAEQMIHAGLPDKPISLGSWSIVGLDSHQDDVPKAHVDAAKLESLMTQWSARNERFAMLATHHPLLPIGSPWLDKDRVEQPGDLLDALINSSGPIFSGALFGHAHQEIQGHYRHHPLLGTPSTAFQFLPRTRQFSTDVRPPGYRWVTLGDNGEVDTQVRWLH